MTRDEALRRLHGTWAFEARGDEVVVRETSVVDTIRRIQRELDVAALRARAAVEGAEPQAA